jgi:SAM-dependent methyltransferase
LHLSPFGVGDSRNHQQTSWSSGFGLWSSRFGLWIPRMMNSVARLAKRLNWALRNWSTVRDHAFHDALFAAQLHDPMSDAYPGRLTIRRFADLAAQHIQAADYVLDLGCGPGEITCELAHRLPGSQFVGVDHSAEGLARAERLAASLGLTNIRFELDDLEHHQPHRRVGLVTMFDAFHHLLDPAGFVQRVGRSCDRFFLVEPAGSWLGQWQKTLDLDWLAESIFVIRDRLEYQFGLTPTAPGGSASVPPAGEPTEHRYSIEDFSRWFTGFGIDICGTVAGLETYGVEPSAKSALRDDIGRSVYNLVIELEATLRRHDLDLAAKHWAVYAERGRSFPKRRVPNLPERLVRRPLLGPYDVEYGGFDGPAEAKTGTVIDAVVHLVNRSWRLWDSLADDGPVFIGYHWLDAKGGMIAEDGLRSRLPRPIAPGESCKAALRIRCPDEPGRFTLAIDLVHEHVTWFSAAGAAPLRIPLRVVR